MKQKLDNLFNIIEKERNINRNIKIVDSKKKCNKYFKKYQNTCEKHYESKCIHFGKFKDKDEQKRINKKLSKVPIHRELQQRSCDDLICHFHPNSLYLAAVSFIESLYPKKKWDLFH